MSEAQQFIGRNCFLVLAVKSDEHTNPEVEIHILEHRTDEDNVPRQKLVIKGKQDLEAMMQACRYALNKFQDIEAII